MRGRQFNLFFLAFTMQLGITVVCSHAQPPSNADVINSLRAWDDALARGLYISGKLVTPAPPTSSATPARNESFRHTRWDSFYATEQVFQSEIAGTTRPAVIGGSQGKSAVPLRTLILCDDTRFVRFQSLALDDTPSGEPDISGRTREIVLLNPPDSAAYARDRYELLFALGRGFSKQIDEVDSVEQLADGMLKISATGHQFDRSPDAAGRWELLIDTNSGYLVRSAEYFEPGARRSQFLVTTEGTTAVEDWIVSQSGKCTTRLGRVRDLEFEYNFAEVELNPNMEFAQYVGDKLDQPLPKRSIVHDSRSGKTEVLRVGLKRRNESNTSGSGFQFGVIALNIVVIIALLVLLARRWKAKA